MIEPINPAALSPEEKLDFLRNQIASVRRGDSSKIRCPYCSGANRPSDKLWCCPTCWNACEAILTRMEQQDGIDAIEQIQTAHDNAYRRVN